MSKASDKFLKRVLQAVGEYEGTIAWAHEQRPSVAFERCKEALMELDPELRAAVVTDLRVWLARCASERTGTPPCSCKGTVNILWSPKHKDPEQLLVCEGCAESLMNEHPDYVRLT